MGIVQRKLNNGMRVNMVSMGDEPQRVSVRMYVPGGRMLESKNTPGSVLVGSRTIQEGGAFLDVTRYEISIVLVCLSVCLSVFLLSPEPHELRAIQTDISV